VPCGEARFFNDFAVHQQALLLPGVLSYEFDESCIGFIFGEKLRNEQCRTVPRQKLSTKWK
jgi:hypothetical protein